MRRICVYCGSNAGKAPKYAEAARDLADVLVRHEIELVYGGSDKGTMGILADAVLDLGGRVHGVIPQMLMEKEVAHQGVTELHVVGSMHARKTMMAALSDGFIALPGGYGTLEE
ncbi:MAG: TIGR00730 family Rossman fold protein, partial [Proteobacteria bacterium]|nr:TIGR00730 family Rossman fold protein [Pseudomonadota bacterium]